MNRIENLNTLGCCNEQNCSKPATHYELVKINKLRVYVSLCYTCMENWNRGRKEE